MPGNYIPIFIFALIVAAVPAVGFALTRCAARNPSASSAPPNPASEPLAFEETERRQNSSQIFLVGALFVVCDALIIFMLPWAVRIGEMGAYGLLAIGGFLAAVVCGYVWLYRNRALERL
ncbi:MAG TPA: NADH-quinone oxidoreductase subunit A [Candidatus Dormibacteraeota bacterium]|nr:NADH-quinone oxidoreductase subunit A [Candidatus Dormibacteraeota bacterium]